MFNGNYLDNYLDRSKKDIFKDLPSPSVQLFHREQYESNFCNKENQDSLTRIYDGVLFSKEDSIEDRVDGIKDLFLQYAYFEVNKLFGINVIDFLNLDNLTAKIILDTAIKITKEKEAATSKAMADMDKIRNELKQ